MAVQVPDKVQAHRRNFSDLFPHRIRTLQPRVLVHVPVPGGSGGRINTTDEEALGLRNVARGRFPPPSTTHHYYPDHHHTHNTRPLRSRSIRNRQQQYQLYHGHHRHYNHQEEHQEHRRHQHQQQHVFTPLETVQIADHCSPKSSRYSARSSASASPSLSPSPSLSDSPTPSASPSLTGSRTATPSPPVTLRPRTQATTSTQEFSHFVTRSTLRRNSGNNVDRCCWGIIYRRWFTCETRGSARIDCFSRITFPLMFIVFNLIYWSTYLFRDDESIPMN